jgi:valyl-tRNA synthetase
MAGVKNIHIDGKISGSGAHAVLKNGTEVFIPLEGVIDLVKERERLNVEILRLKGLVEGARQKLSNEKFLTGAPADVVEREKLKQDSFLQQLSVLNRKIESLTDV